MADQPVSEVVKVEMIGGVPVVRLLAPRLEDTQLTEQVKQELARLADEFESTGMVIDLSKVDIIASRGLAALAALNERLHRRLRIFGMNEDVKYLFWVVCLDQIVGVDASEAAALTALQRPA